MSFVDPIGDMITRIRNAQMRFLSSVKIPRSKFRVKILSFTLNCFEPLGPVKINFPFSTLTVVFFGIWIGFFPSLDISN